MGNVGPRAGGAITAAMFLQALHRQVPVGAPGHRRQRLEVRRRQGRHRPAGAAADAVRAGRAPAERMPQVDFHSGVGAPLRFACRLLRKAWRQGAAVLVTAPSADAGGAGPRAVDLRGAGVRAAPAGAAGAGRRCRAARARRSGCARASRPAPCPKVLVNLGADCPTAGEPFERIIEIVPGDGEERQRARARWRAYEARGWTITAPSAGGGLTGSWCGLTTSLQRQKTTLADPDSGRACQSRIIVGTSFFTGTPS